MMAAAGKSVYMSDELRDQITDKNIEVYKRTGQKLSFSKVLCELAEAYTLGNIDIFKIMAENAQANNK